MIVIWGCNFAHILEALAVGIALYQTSTRRRICFVNDVPIEMQHLLNIIWETREFAHLNVSEMKRRGISKRLSRAYSKLQAWSWLAGTFVGDGTLTLFYFVFFQLYKFFSKKSFVVYLIYR